MVRKESRIMSLGHTSAMHSKKIRGCGKWSRNVGNKFYSEILSFYIVLYVYFMVHKSLIKL